MKNQKTGVTIKEANQAEEQSKILKIETPLFTVKGREAGSKFKTQLLNELVELEEVEANKPYKTLQRVKEALNEMKSPIVISIQNDLLKIFKLSYCFVEATYLYKVGEFKVNFNIFKGLGVKTIIYSYLLFDEVRTVLIVDKADYEDLKEEIIYLGEDTEENKTFLRSKCFKGDELELLETLKRLREEQRPQVKPVDEIKPAYFIYQEMKRQGETKELNYCLLIAQGKTADLSPSVIRRYEAKANELIEQGRTELLREREAKAEAKEKIAEAEDYYMKDLLF